MLSNEDQKTPKNVVLYTTDTMADWEYAYITAEITRAERLFPGRFRLLTASESPACVHTLGGFSTTPMVTLDSIVPADTACLVIPGADTYTTGHEALSSVAMRMLDAHVPVAAICGATLFLARCGLLDNRNHTSDSAGFLASTGYRGESHYIDAPVMTDGGITTASGTRPVQFSAEVFRRINLYPDTLVDAWLDLNLTNDESAFFHLKQEEQAFANS